MSLFNKSWLPFGVPSVPILTDANAGQCARSTLSYVQLNQAARQTQTLTVSATVTFLMNVVFSAPDGSGGTYGYTYASNVSVPWTWSVKLEPANYCLGVGSGSAPIPFKAADYTSQVTPAEKTGIITTTDTSSPASGSGSSSTFTSNIALEAGALQPAINIARHPVAPWLQFSASLTINGVIAAPGYAFSSELNLFTGTLAAWQATDQLPADTSVYHSATGDAGTIFGAPLSYQAYNYANTVNFDSAHSTGGEYLTITGVSVTLD